MGTQGESMEQYDREKDRASSDVLLRYVGALCKPLAYVADNKFANLETVKGLDEAVLAVVRQALTAARLPDHLATLQRIQHDFESFSRLALDRRRDVVANALAALKTIETQVRSLVHDRAPDPDMGPGHEERAGAPAPAEGTSSSATKRRDPGPTRDGAPVAPDRSPPATGSGARPTGGDTQEPPRPSGQGDRPEAASKRTNGQPGAADGRSPEKRGKGARNAEKPPTPAQRNRGTDRQGKGKRRNDPAQPPRKKGEDPRKKRKKSARRPKKRVMPVYRDVAVAYRERSDQDLSWGRPRRTALLRSPSGAYVADLPPPPGAGDEVPSAPSSAGPTAPTATRRKAGRRGRRKKTAKQKDGGPVGNRATAPGARDQDTPPPAQTNGSPDVTPGPATREEPPPALPIDLPPLDGLPDALTPDGLYHDLTLGDVADFIEKVEPPPTSDGDLAPPESTVAREGDIATATGIEDAGREGPEILAAGATAGESRHLEDKATAGKLDSCPRDDGEDGATPPGSGIEAPEERHVEEDEGTEVDGEEGDIEEELEFEEEVDEEVEEEPEDEEEGEEEEEVDEEVEEEDEEEGEGEEDDEEELECEEEVHEEVEEEPNEEDDDGGEEEDDEEEVIVPASPQDGDEEEAPVVDDGEDVGDGEDHEDEIGQIAEGVVSLHDPLEDDGESTIEEFFEELVRRGGGVPAGRLLAGPVTKEVEMVADGADRGEGKTEQVKEAGRSGRSRRRRRKKGVRGTGGRGGDGDGSGPMVADSEPGTAEDRLALPLTEVKGVGARLGAALGKKGIKTIGDLLLRLPVDYHDRRQVTAISAVCEGESHVVLGVIDSSELHSEGGRRDLVVVIRDDEGAIACVWRNVRSNYLRNRFRVGSRLLAWGKVTKAGGRQVIEEPDTEPVGGGADEEALNLGRIVPVYEPMEGVGQKVFRRIVHEALERVRGSVRDPLPEATRRRQGLLDYEEALRLAHFPPPDADAASCRARTTPFWRTLAFHELFLLQFALAHGRKVLANEPGQPRRLVHGRVARLLQKVSPLTEDQAAAMEEIKRDLAATHPMFRYLHADPRAGAFLLAASAILHVVDTDWQVAVVVSDEFWAEKVAWVLRNLLGPVGVEVEILSSAARGRAREKLSQAIRRGECPLVVGTAELFHNGRQMFKRLGLVVIHEGETIGRHDRKLFKRQANTPDVLVLSAVPVHPVLLQTLRGDSTWSELRQPATGRSHIRTEVVGEENRVHIEEHIRSSLKEGQQMVYCVPRQGENHQRAVQTIMTNAGRLRDEVFPGIPVGYLHHRLHPAEQRTMVEKFANREIQIMVTPAEPDPRLATHRTSLMIVDRADQLSLSRINALRAMTSQSIEEPAVFLVPSPDAGTGAMERLSVVAENDDGFLLAKRDCEEEGWRNYPGMRNQPLTDLAVADLLVHRDELERARREAFRWVDGSPESRDVEAGHALARLARARWGSLAESVPLPPETSPSGS